MNAEADFAMTDLAMAQTGQSPQQKEKLLVRFYMNPKKDQAASDVEGRPIYRDVEYIEIRIPGTRDVVMRPVWDEDRSRFPVAYQAFKNGKDQEAQGTPLNMIPWITKPQVEELAYFNVKTLEQLAEIPDSNAQKFMGINALRQRARDFLTAAKESAPLSALRSEIEKKDSELAAANEAIRDLGERLAALEKAKK